MPGEQTFSTEKIGPSPSHRWREIRIPMATILKVVGSGLGVWAAFLLWPECLLFLLSVVLAVALHPAVRWMEGRRIGRALGVVSIAIVGIGLLTAFVVFVLPPLTRQATQLLASLPDFRTRILSKIPARLPAVQRVVDDLLRSPSSSAVAKTLGGWFGWGRSAASGIVAAAVVAVLTLYLLLNGRSLYAWMLAFVPRTHREKLALTMHEVSGVVHAYVSGQMFAVVLFASFSGVLLSILGVPAAVPLAILAGLFDVVPVLGIVLATVPAVLLALVVSPATAVVVLLAYVAYHLFEAYFLLPRIYGNKLKISGLSVLLAILVGVKLQGILGAILVLPLVAAYPIVERHWLRGYLAARVLTDHKALAKAAETGSEVAIDTVLHGEKHASEGPPSPGGRE